MPYSHPSVQIEWSYLKDCVGEEKMNLVTMEVKCSAVEPTQDVEPLQRATAPQVRERDEFVEG